MGLERAGAKEKGAKVSTLKVTTMKSTTANSATMAGSACRAVRRATAHAKPFVLALL